MTVIILLSTQVMILQAEESLLSTMNLGTGDDDDEEEVYVRNTSILKISFLRNFIRIMKLTKPILSAEAGHILAEEFANLRALDAERGLERSNALTARMMETMIRLATAHAKARASKTVDPEDARAALELVRYAYFGVERRRQGEDEDGDSEDDYEDVEGEDGDESIEIDEDADTSIDDADQSIESEGE